MPTDAPAIPRVEETGLDRDDLTNAADELGIDGVESLDDQQLFERIGLRLGEISEEQLAAAADGEQDAGGDSEESDADTGEEAGNTGEEAQDTGEEAQDSADDAGKASQESDEDTGEEAHDSAEDTEDETDDEVTEDRKQARDRGEYRFEDDERPDIASVLDLELGPVALDLLGLEVHLNRLHAVIAANPGPDYALLGKLLATLASVGNTAGLGKLTDAVTKVADSLLDFLPSPDLDATRGGKKDDDEDDGGDGSVMDALAKPLAGAGRFIKNLAAHAKEAAEESKEAGSSGAGAVKNAAKGNTLRALKDGKNAADHVKGAASSLATGT